MNTIILARNGVGCLGTVEGRHLAAVVSKAARNDGDCRLPQEVERWCLEVEGLHIGQQPHDAARGGSAGTSGGGAVTNGGSGNSGDAGGGSGGIVEQSGKARVRARNGSGAPAAATAVTPGSLVPAMPAPMRVPFRDGSTGGLQAQPQRAANSSAPEGQADEQTAAADVCMEPGAAPDGWERGEAYENACAAPHHEPYSQYMEQDCRRQPLGESEGHGPAYAFQPPAHGWAYSPDTPCHSMGVTVTSGATCALSTLAPCGYAPAVRPHREWDTALLQQRTLERACLGADQQATAAHPISTAWHTQGGVDGTAGLREGKYGPEDPLEAATQLPRKQLHQHHYQPGAGGTNLSGGDAEEEEEAVAGALLPLPGFEPGTNAPDAGWQYEVYHQHVHQQRRSGPGPVGGAAPRTSYLFPPAPLALGDSTWGAGGPTATAPLAGGAHGAAGTLAPGSSTMSTSGAADDSLDSPAHLLLVDAAPFMVQATGDPSLELPPHGGTGWPSPSWRGSVDWRSFNQAFSRPPSCEEGDQMQLGGGDGGGGAGRSPSQDSAWARICRELSSGSSGSLGSPLAYRAGGRGLSLHALIPPRPSVHQADGAAGGPGGGGGGSAAGDVHNRRDPRKSGLS